MIMESVQHFVNAATIDSFFNRVLRAVPQYGNGCVFSLKAAKPADIVPLARFAMVSRLRIASRLLYHFWSSRVLPFETVLYSEDGKVRLILPPVIEKQGETMYLMDGTHRVLAAMSHQVSSIKCLIVAGESLPPLPCRPGSWEELKVVEGQQPIGKILPDLDPSLFRPLTPLFNSSQFIFETSADALGFIRLPSRLTTTINERN